MPETHPGWFERAHLRRLDRVWARDPVFFITACTKDRRPQLAHPAFADALLGCLVEARGHCRWRVGGYTVMPDHVHLLCAPGESADSLNAFVGRFKSRSTRT